MNVAAFIVIGFPHYKENHSKENLVFIDRLAEHGITDLSVRFNMALPGTELFHSFYDSGKIKLDRACFRHILDSHALIPSQRYREELSRWDLFCWKLKFYWRFYGAKKQHTKKQGIVTSIFTAARGLFVKGEHTSKLETAFHNGVTSGVETLMTLFRGHWISKKEEAKIFDEWDQTYRNIREKKLQRGLVIRAPSDTRELHKGNVIAQLELDHEQARQI